MDVLHPSHGMPRCIVGRMHGCPMSILWDALCPSHGMPHHITRRAPGCRKLGLSLGWLRGGSRGGLGAVQEAGLAALTVVPCPQRFLLHNIFRVCTALAREVQFGVGAGFAERLPRGERCRKIPPENGLMITESKI